MQVSHLSVLLAAQLGLAGFLWYSNNQQTQPVPLLAASELSELTLVKGPGRPDTESADQASSDVAAPAQQITLRKQQDQWQFSAGTAQKQLWLAANPAKTQQLLTDLQKARLNWPLADSADSQRRFAVSPQAYQWQLQLKAAGTDSVQTLWLGDSAGLRQQYVRRDGENAVYQVALNSYELSIEPEQWLDKNQLAFKEIQAVRGPDYSLVRTLAETTSSGKSAESQGWQLTGLAPVATADVAGLNQTEADQLLSKLQTLTVLQHLPEPSKQAEQAFNQAFRLTVSAADHQGKTADLSLLLAKVDNQYLIRRSDLDAVFSVEQSLYDSLVSTNLAKLSQTPEQQVAKTEHSPGQQMLNNLSQQLTPGQTAPSSPQTNTPAAGGATDNAKPD